MIYSFHSTGTCSGVPSTMHMQVKHGTVCTLPTSQARLTPLMVQEQLRFQMQMRHSAAGQGRRSSGPDFCIYDLVLRGCLYRSGQLHLRPAQGRAVRPTPPKRVEVARGSELRLAMEGAGRRRVPRGGGRALVLVPRG